MVLSFVCATTHEWSESSAVLGHSLMSGNRIRGFFCFGGFWTCAGHLAKFHSTAGSGVALHEQYSYLQLGRKAQIPFVKWSFALIVCISVLFDHLTVWSRVNLHWFWFLKLWLGCGCLFLPQYLFYSVMSPWFVWKSYKTLRYFPNDNCYWCPTQALVRGLGNLCKLS